MSRLIRAIALALGAATLLTAAFTQAVTPAPVSTVQSGTHASHKITPITFGLVPPQHSARKTKPTKDADTLYDYINPCGLIPLSEIRKATGNYQLKFDSKSGGMTTDVSKAQTSTINNSTLPEVCALGSDPNDVKIPLFIGVKTQQSAKDFRALSSGWSNSDYHGLQNMSTFGLPGAREATTMYVTVGGRQLYQMLFVHTKYGQTLIVKWSGSSTVLVLRQLAYEALRTLNGTRYAGK